MAEQENGNGKVHAAVTDEKLEALAEQIGELKADFRAYAAEATRAASLAATTQATLCERVQQHDRDIQSLKGESRLAGALNAIATAAVGAWVIITGGR